MNCSALKPVDTVYNRDMGCTNHSTNCNNDLIECLLAVTYDVKDLFLSIVVEGDGIDR